MTDRWTQKRMAEIATEERRELGLAIMDPLDPYELAESHGISVYPISELGNHGCSAITVEHFSVKRKKAWSAALIPVGRARIIVENDSHELVRRRSSLAHEMSHHLLEHQFVAALLTEDHSRAYSEKVEKEALFLSGELLVPAEACKRLAFDEADNATVAQMFAVSIQFAQMRMAGPRVMAKRARQKQSRARR